jgi:hypothetical protein
MLLRISKDIKPVVPVSGAHKQKCIRYQNSSDRVYRSVLPIITYNYADCNKSSLKYEIMDFYTSPVNVN